MRHIITLISVIIYINCFSQTQIETVVQAGHYAEITAIATSSNNQFLFTGSKDKTIKLWNIHSGKEIRQYIGHNASIIDLQVDINNERILSVSIDSTAILWDIKSSKIIHKFQLNKTQILNACFHPDGKHIATGTKKNGRFSHWGR